MVSQSRFRIERQIELIVPTEFEAGFTQRIITYLSAGKSLSQVSGVCCNFIGNTILCGWILVVASTL